MNSVIVPARSGSKGIPRKNIKMLNGKPLIAYSILAAHESKVFDKIIVSTEDIEIAEVAKQYGAETRDRPNELAADHVHSVHVVLDCIEHYKMEPDDLVCMLLPTSPFRTSEDIYKSVDLLHECDSVISVVKCDHTISSFRTLSKGQLCPIVSVENYEAQRQGSELYEVNGSIYVSTAANLKINKSFHKGHIVPYIMSKERSIDINDLFDWNMAELLMENKSTNIKV